MIAIDTNILVYAAHENSPWHKSADRLLTELAESGTPWAIPWPCLHEFLAIVTHTRIFRPPMALEDALFQVEAWLETPTLHTLSEGKQYWHYLRQLMTAANTSGPVTHDARIAALCLEHGVEVLWSADRDLSRFPKLKVVNPLVQASH